MWKKIFLFFFILSFLLLIGGSAVGVWAYYFFTRDLPNIESIGDYRPAAVTSVFSNSGEIVAEFYDERRYTTKLQDIPVLVRQAFLASEDVSFYKHKGIDPTSILRAMVRNILAGSARQGASTITQQVVKNLLLTPERKLERKVKEAILSYRLEEKLSKDEILEIYLNQIFLGNGSYGVKAAARGYFHKELKDLTIAEAALLAGLPQAPSKYSPISHFSKAKHRQRYVLSQMEKNGFITPEQSEESEKERMRLYPPDTKNIFKAPFYVAEVRRIFAEKWRDYNIDRDGLQIYTALDVNADQMATSAVRKGLREVDKRRGWRGPVASDASMDREGFIKAYSASISGSIEPSIVYPALVTSISRASGLAQLDLGHYRGSVNLKEASWAKKKIESDDRVTWIKPEEIVRPGDVIEVSQTLAASAGAESAPGEISGLVLDQTPDLESALVLIDPESGKVLTVVGGYSYQRSVFNRATQALRQPGSTFKPILYLTAVDAFKYTPATIVHDAPRTFRVGDEFWTPANYDKNYMGDITLRTALQNSRNLVSADIVSRIGVDAVIRYAKKLGITSPLGRNLSLALGSSEVTVLEITRAYGVFAAKGVLFDSVFVTKVVDRYGNILYDYENDKLNQAHQAINEGSAFIMSSLLKGVVEHGTGQRVKALGRPVGGKTGTSNELMDAWFVGFTPHWVCGVWTGFDQKKKIGEKETGGAVSAPTFLYFMKDFLDYEEKTTYAKLEEEAKAEAQRLGIEYTKPDPIQPIDFSVPEGVDPYWVDKYGGALTEQGATNAIYEYFIRGTEPVRASSAESASKNYLESPDL